MRAPAAGPRDPAPIREEEGEEGPGSVNPSYSRSASQRDDWGDEEEAQGERGLEVKWGVSIGGGIGTVAGTLLGALFTGVIVNALPVMQVSPFWQMAISGSAIIIAVAFNASQSRVKGRIILKQAET